MGPILRWWERINQESLEALQQIDLREFYLAVATTAPKMARRHAIMGYILAVIFFFLSWLFVPDMLISPLSDTLLTIVSLLCVGSFIGSPYIGVIEHRAYREWKVRLKKECEEDEAFARAYYEATHPKKTIAQERRAHYILASLYLVLWIVLIMDFFGTFRFISLFLGLVLPSLILPFIDDLTGHNKLHIGIFVIFLISCFIRVCMYVVEVSNPQIILYVNIGVVGSLMCITLLLLYGALELRAKVIARQK